MRPAVPLLLVLCLAAHPAPVRAQEIEYGFPVHNASYVPDDDETVRGLIGQAVGRAEAGNADGAIEALQALLLMEEGGVIALHGRELFLPPRRWAAMQLLGERAPFGSEVLEAWRQVHDAAANSAIRAAVEADDEPALMRLLARYPAATAAPGALLALADRALQQGRADAALGYLMRAPEHVEQSKLAAWLASPAYVERKRYLEGLPTQVPEHWTTLCGDASRSRNGDPLPDRLALHWEGLILEEDPLTFRYRSQFNMREHSPMLPFYPVMDGERIYIHLGPAVRVIDRATGKVLYNAPGVRQIDEFEVDAMLAKAPGVRAATLADGVLYFNRVLFRPGRLQALERHNALVAFDVARRSVLWEARRGMGGVLDKAVFFRGAPAVVGDRLYVYGAVREVSEGRPSRKEEAYLFCFHRLTGKLLWHRFLGYGDTEAAPGLPPQSGLAPAVARGVVVAVTGLGVAAALDATTGELLWLIRYNRKPVRERERLTEWNEEQVHIGSGWFREPPRIVGDSVVFAPTDSDGSYSCWLRGSRRDGRFFVEQWYRKRTDNDNRNSLLEQIAGVARGRVYYVGRRDPDRLVASYQTVVGRRVDYDTGLAFGRIPAFERDPDSGDRVPAEVYGRPTIAGPALLVPTRSMLFRFDVARDPTARMAEGERITEIPPLPPYLPPARAVPEGQAPPAAFGSLVAVGGKLYAVTGHRVLCYGAPK